MRNFSKAVAGAVALALCVSAAQAAERSQIYKASGLIGQTVTDAQGNELGTIEDVALDLQKGEINYVVLAATGNEEKLVAMPADALRQGPGGEGLTAQISQQQIEQSLGFTQDRWPRQPTLQTGGQGGGQAQPQFSQLDQDGDGFVTQQEASNQQQLVQQFDRADLNADGQLSQREYNRFARQQQAGDQPADELELAQEDEQLVW